MKKISEVIIPYLESILSEMGLLYKNIDDKMKEIIEVLNKIARKIE